MYKRKKGEHGIFYSPQEIMKNKKTGILIYIFFLLILLFFNIIFNNSTAYSEVHSNNRIDQSTIYDIISGFIYYNNGDYGQASKLFSKEVAKMRGSYGYFMLASFYFKDKELEKSLYCINKAIKLKSFGPKGTRLTKIEVNYLTLKARILANKNNIKDSVGILNGILKTNPANLKTLLLLTDIYLYEKNISAAVIYLNLIKLNHPRNMDAYYELYKIYISENNKRLAEKNLLKLISINPYFKKAYFELASVYILSGKDKKAIELFKRYLKIDPYSKTALYQSALLEYTLKQYSKARKHFKIFLNLTNRQNNFQRLRNNAYFFSGVSYFIEKRYNKSIAYLNKLREGRHYADAKLTEIEIYLDNYRKTKNKDYKDSVKEIIKSLLKDESLNNKLKVYYFTAIALANIKSYNYSKVVIKKGLQRFPNNTRLLYELGSAYHSLKNDKKAVFTMEKILKIDPYDADALNYLGYFLAVNDKGGKNLNDLKKAYSYLQKALSVDKGSPYILDSMGFVKYRYKKYADALKYFKAALKKLGKSPTVLKHIGMDYLKLKDYGKALKYFNESYKIKKTLAVKKYIEDIMHLRK